MVFDTIKKDQKKQNKINTSLLSRQSSIKNKYQGEKLKVIFQETGSAVC